ncbi:hypothetical protein HW555_012615 [Spodoptera exigua]|uniref:Gustatory receptor n=1 Tax=Spodoptera exigua TaxID=7107 RepID=A0A835G765_SPOEX|nr:hypothetical protein HW555_012615 [Spodoptera exigua]
MYGRSEGLKDALIPLRVVEDKSHHFKRLRRMFVSVENSKGFFQVILKLIVLFNRMGTGADMETIHPNQSGSGFGRNVYQDHPNPHRPNEPMETLTRKQPQRDYHFDQVIFFRTIDLFMRGLIYLYLYLIVLKTSDVEEEIHNYTIIATLIVGLDWMIKNIIIISAICMQCEKFQMHIEEAESACIQLVMKRDCPKSNKYLYKRVLQYNHLFTKMSAYGFFTFDAKLPMPLLGLLTNYIIRLRSILFTCLILVSWMLKDIIMINCICVRCEKFYICLEEAKSVCIQRVMLVNCPTSYNRLCKRVLQVNRTFNKMSAYGFFTIDANLPVPFARLMTSYIIILLQFSFL